MSITKESQKVIKFNKDGKRVEMVPPDGGWGYMICFTLIITFITILAVNTSFGLIYNDFLISIDAGSRDVSVMHAVGTCIVSVISPFTTGAIKRYSLRQVGLVGSLIASLGYFLNVFATTMTGVILYSGVVAFGSGIAMSVVYTVFNSYFVKKRVFVLSTCQFVVGVSCMVYPIVIKWLMDQYGFRGTLAILAALSLNSAIGMLFVHPVAWHLVEKIVDEEDQGKELDANDLGSNIQINIQYTDGDKTVNKEKISNEDQENENVKATLLIQTNDRRFSTPSIKITNTDRRPSMPPNDDDGDDAIQKNLKDQLQAVSLLSIGSFHNASLSYQLNNDNKDKLGVWQKISTVLDLKLLKDYVYLNIVIGMSASLFSETMFSLLFPLMLFNIGFTADQVALSLSSYAAGDMVARFLLAGVSKFIPLKPRNIFFTGVLLSFSFRIVINLTEEFYIIATISAIIGIAKCLTQVTIPLILGDHVPIEKYPAAYGLFMLFNGVTNVILGPIVGIMRDLTNSYKLTFDLLTCALLLCLVGWTVEGVLNRRKIKKKVLE